MLRKSLWDNTRVYSAVAFIIGAALAPAARQRVSLISLWPT